MSEREPELHIHLKSGSIVPLSVPSLDYSDDEMEMAKAVTEYTGNWRLAGACIGVPAPGWTAARLVIVPWNSVEFIDVVW